VAEEGGFYANMSRIIIRKYQNPDCKDVLKICYKTGYMGNDLESTGKFDDMKLFGYFFCMYYLLYERDHCFVAVDKDNNCKVVGYIIGTLDTNIQIRLFIKKMLIRIGLRILYTIWKYPDTFKNIMNMLKNRTRKYTPKSLYCDYPAHFHINLLPEYQGMGIGMLLLTEFEVHVKGSAGKGIHLKTSNKNYNAIKFYEKNGYVKLLEFTDILWVGIENYKTVIFTKKL